MDFDINIPLCAQRLFVGSLSAPYEVIRDIKAQHGQLAEEPPRHLETFFLLDPKPLHPHPDIPSSETSKNKLEQPESRASCRHFKT